MNKGTLLRIFVIAFFSYPPGSAYCLSIRFSVLVDNRRPAVVRIKQLDALNDL